MPRLGCIVPAIICSNVLFPDPFNPIIPKEFPLQTEKLIFSKAVNDSKFVWFDFLEKMQCNKAFQPVLPKFSFSEIFSNILVTFETVRISVSIY